MLVTVKSMMYGYGDEETPYQATVDLLEVCLLPCTDLWRISSWITLTCLHMNYDMEAAVTKQTMRAMCLQEIVVDYVTTMGHIAMDQAGHQGRRLLPEDFLYLVRKASCTSIHLLCNCLCQLCISFMHASVAL